MQKRALSKVKSELRSAAEAMAATVERSSLLLEELLEHALLAAETTAREGRACKGAASARAASACGVVGVVALVEASLELGIGQDFVGFIHSSHLGFAAAFVRMGLHHSFATVSRS